jgi:hypothetical protein
MDDPRKALEGYIWEMRKWVALAKTRANLEGRDSGAPTGCARVAKTLVVRLDMLKQEIIPY